MSQADDGSPVSERDRMFWLKRRQAVLIELAAIEDHLGMMRSVTPKRQRVSRRCTEDAAEQIEEQQISA
jgi:hypothetical protein